VPSPRTWRRCHEFDGIAIRIPQLQRGLTQFENHTIVRDAEDGEFPRPCFERVAVGHSKGEMVEW